MEMLKLRGDFAKNNVVNISGLIQEELLTITRSDLEGAEFSISENLGRDLTVGPTHKAYVRLFFLLNKDNIFSMIRSITGCKRIGSFAGRIYRLEPIEGRYDEWHNDCIESRQIAISVNLGESYCGGVTQIRNVSTREICGTAANRNPGDALLLKIDPSLEHRVSAVRGTHARTAVAGFFRETPTFKEMMVTR